MRRFTRQARIVGLLVTGAVALTLGGGVASAQPPPPSNPEEPGVHREYTYPEVKSNPADRSTPNAITATSTCTILVDDPVFHTTSVDGFASQVCGGAYGTQSLTVCVQERNWYFFWFTLGCKTGGPTVNALLSVLTDRYDGEAGYVYRVRAYGTQGGTSSPWIYSDEVAWN